MIVAAVIFALAFCLALLIARTALRARNAIHSVEEWERKKVYVSIEALQSLIDQDEELYLKESLSPGLFRRIQRQRMRLAIELINRVGRNSAMLLQLAESGAATSGEFAAAARETSRIAAQVRLNATLATICLYVKWLFPGSKLRIPTRWLAYRKLAECDVRSLYPRPQCPLSSL